MSQPLGGELPRIAGVTDPGVTPPAHDPAVPAQALAPDLERTDGSQVVSGDIVTLGEQRPGTLSALGGRGIGIQLTLADLTSEVKTAVVANAAGVSSRKLNSKFDKTLGSIFKRRNEKALAGMLATADAVAGNIEAQHGTFATRIEKKDGKKYVVVAALSPNQNQTEQAETEGVPAIGVNETQLIIAAIEARRSKSLRKMIRFSEEFWRPGSYTKKLAEAALRGAGLTKRKGGAAETIAQRTTPSDIGRIGEQRGSLAPLPPDAYGIARNAQKRVELRGVSSPNTAAETERAIDATEFMTNLDARRTLVRIARGVWTAGDVLRRGVKKITDAVIKSRDFGRLLLNPTADASGNRQASQDRVREWVRAEMARLRDPKSAPSGPEELRGQAESIATLALYMRRDRRLRSEQRSLSSLLGALDETGETRRNWKQRWAHNRLSTAGAAAVGKQMERLLEEGIWARIVHKSSRKKFTLEQLIDGLEHNPAQVYLDRKAQTWQRFLEDARATGILTGITALAALSPLIAGGVLVIGSGIIVYKTAEAGVKFSRSKAGKATGKAVAGTVTYLAGGAWDTFQAARGRGARSRSQQATQ